MENLLENRIRVQLERIVRLGLLESGETFGFEVRRTRSTRVSAMKTEIEKIVVVLCVSYV